MRLIDADALMIRLMDKNLDHVQDNDGAELCQIIDNQPTVQAVPIFDNATNGDVIKAMFGNDVTISFHFVQILAKLGKWFNKGVVAEFDKTWWNAPYEGSDTE